MKTRKAFAFLEFALVVVILGLLAAVFIPAAAMVREKARDDVIESQLSEIIRKGEAYMREKDISSVDYKTLVEAKAIEPMGVVAGESYDGIVLQRSGGTVVLKKADGKEIVRSY